MPNSATAVAVKPKNNTATQSINNVSSPAFQTISGFCPFSFRKFQNGDPVRPRVGGVQYCTSDGFEQWLDSINSSLVFSSYGLNALFLLGINPEGKLAISHDAFRNCMGLQVDGHQLHLATVNQILSFRQQSTDDQVQQAENHGPFYVHATTHTVGSLHTHDLVCNASGEVLFVNTHYNCLATVSQTASFKAVWKPPFITDIAYGDRCHLNGVAMVNHKPRYVTTISDSNQVGDWRNHRENGGCLIDVENNEILLKGLSMPHSPRWYQGKLWLHNSGTGEFGYIDNLDGNPTFQPIASCPGFLRGLTFHQNYAIVGTSAPRDQLFADLAWSRNLFQQDNNPGCGLLVIDLETGAIIHWLYLGNRPKWDNISDCHSPATPKMEAAAKAQAQKFQLYDVQLIAGIKNPSLISARSKSLEHHISFESLV